MAQQRNNARPGDFTGMAKAKLQKEHADAVKDREGELAMMEAAEAEAAQNRVTDLTGTQPVIENDPAVVAAAEALLHEQGLSDDDVQLLDGVEEVGPRASAPVLIRINSTLDSVTIGAGNNYSFVEGEKYRVPAHVAAHLEEKGYVWH